MSAKRYLADTHIVLWALADDKRLSKSYRDILLSDAIIYFSAASIWEIAIKKSLGKLQAPADLASLLEQAGYKPLEIGIAHAQAVAELPFHHSDPFDRLLIVQSQLEKLVLLSTDKSMALYDIEIA